MTATSRRQDARAILARELEAIDLACSRFRGDSELVALNRSNGSSTRVSKLLLEALCTSLDVAAATDGAVDPTVGAAMAAIGYDRDLAEVRAVAPRPAPSPAPRVAGWDSIEVDRTCSTVQLPTGAELDLGASAKALCADRACAAIHEALGGGVLVNLGGDIAMAGEPPAGGWVVRVTDDHAANASAPGQTVSLRGGGLATSSTTVRRWHDSHGAEVHHIVDPMTGMPAAEVWRTVSVTAACCVDANAASTAAIVGGEGALSWLEERMLPSRLVATSGEVTLVQGWPETESP